MEVILNKKLAKKLVLWMASSVETVSKPKQTSSFLTCITTTPVQTCKAFINKESDGNNMSPLYINTGQTMCHSEASLDNNSSVFGNICPPTQFIYKIDHSNSVVSSAQGFDRLLGHDVRLNSEEDIFSFVYKDDIKDVRILRKISVSVMRMLSTKDRSRASFVMDFRIRNSVGSNIRIMHQCIAAGGTDLNILNTENICTDISYLKNSGRVQYKWNGPGQYVFERLLKREEKNEAPEMDFPLTSREFEIIKLTSLGNTCVEVATKLFISVHTVRTHRRNIIRKLNVGSFSSALMKITEAQFVYQAN